MHVARQRAIFQRLRQRFILMPTEQGQPPLPQDFELTDYLLECSQLQLRAALRLGSSAWLCVGLALLLVGELTLALGPGARTRTLTLTLNPNPNPNPNPHPTARAAGASR